MLLFCPKCETEYKEKIKECPECKELLIEELPSNKLATVLETNDQGLIMVAKSLLKSADINFFIKGEELQNLFGLGQIGFNPIVGTVKIEVVKKDQERAMRLLEELTK